MLRVPRRVGRRASRRSARRRCRTRTLLLGHGDDLAPEAAPCRRRRSASRWRSAATGRAGGGAPRSWTQTSTSGQRRTSAPVAPAWSRWMCVSRIARGTRVARAPRAASSSATPGPDRRSRRPARAQQMTRGRPRCRTSMLRHARRAGVLEARRMSYRASVHGRRCRAIRGLEARLRDAVQQPLLVLATACLGRLRAAHRRPANAGEGGRRRSSALESQRARPSRYAAREQRPSGTGCGATRAAGGARASRRARRTRPVARSPGRVVERQRLVRASARRRGRTRSPSGAVRLRHHAIAPSSASRPS